MKYILDCAYVLAVVLISPRLLYRMFVHKRYREGWAQRLGRITRRFPDKKCIWIHAVSVGEVNATPTLIRRLQEELPDYEIIISTTTDTGYARARNRYEKDHVVFYYPFDLSWIVRRALDRIRPSIILLMELEVWPNLAAQAAQREIPIAIVNGRLSDRSYPRYRLIRFLTRRMFRHVSLVLAQTEEYARRFRYLGCPAQRVRVTSSLKYDTAQITDRIDGTDELARQLQIDQHRLWVAGGTGPGEESIVLDAHKRLRSVPGMEDLHLVIVPRKPERFDEVAGLIEKAGFSPLRYSRIKTSEQAVDGLPEVILGDTMGDLRKFYCLATGPVFVGRSLIPMGGSDMMEPAALGKCTIFGPYTFNFKQTVEALLAENGAIKVHNEEELFQTLSQCLTQKEFAEQVAAHGREVIQKNQGATERTVQAIVDLLG
ncbi:MAG: 3-deoxy-D-manno-octulosonic acid transferase [Sedimentisphaerales bacterium]|nr:3-deoxy-D-manno-octulosonic acid transferase [Sedimentisphaerales bacterium]